MAELYREHEVHPAERDWVFVAADHTDPLGVPDASYDLLISLYAGPISEHCTRHLRPGGWLLVNSSHGRWALAALDDRWLLEAVVLSRAEGYVASTADLAGHLVPKRTVEVTWS